MKLSDLTAYAEEKYRIEEEHKWPDFPGFSVLCSPDTGKWLALLMQQWDSVSGSFIQICDIKCGQQVLGERHGTFLSKPFRMRGKKWVGVRMGQYTDTYAVRSLFDRAVEAERSQRFTIEPGPKPSAKIYSDTPVTYQSAQPRRIPKKIFDMIHLYDFSDASFEGKCRNFYAQGKFMEDFEDDAPCEVTFKHYYTTYHDLNITQLRAYFTWRTNVRKGAYKPISLSLAYMYLYELLCGIGCTTPEEAFGKLQDFERGFLDAGYGDRQMRANLRRWMSGFAVISGMDAETAGKYADPEKLKWDETLSVLKEADAHSDEEIFQSLSFLYPNTRKEWDTPVISKDRERGVHLFALMWRAVLHGRENFFTECFGKERKSVYRPFSNAVYFSAKKRPDTVYVLNACRSYVCENGAWTLRSYDRLYFNKEIFASLIHAADRIFRKYLKTGRYLRKRIDEGWAVRYAESAVLQEEKERQEASKPKITIHFSGLEKIREDAAVTRDSLLTEEELAEEAVSERAENSAEPTDSNELLRMLLHGEDVAVYIKKNHLIPSVITDEINEEFLDEIGDSVLTCDGNRIEVVEDYREDLIELIGDT